MVVVVVRPAIAAFASQRGALEMRSLSWVHACLDNGRSHQADKQTDMEAPPLILDCDDPYRRQPFSFPGVGRVPDSVLRGTWGALLSHGDCSPGPYQKGVR